MSIPRKFFFYTRRSAEQFCCFLWFLGSRSFHGAIIPVGKVERSDAMESLDMWFSVEYCGAVSMYAARRIFDLAIELKLLDIYERMTDAQAEAAQIVCRSRHHNDNGGCDNPQCWKYSGDDNKHGRDAALTEGD